jgi:hypothetical protein
MEKVLDLVCCQKIFKKERFSYILETLLLEIILLADAYVMIEVEHNPQIRHDVTLSLLRDIADFQKRYSQLWPVIALDAQGDVTEIHYNTRTSGPLQAPNNVVIPYYHALKVCGFAKKKNK